MGQIESSHRGINRHTKWDGISQARNEMTVDKKGYVKLSGYEGHPLADKRGFVSRHRLVLWEDLEQPTFSACYWCHYPLPWRSRLTPAYTHCVNVDHLNSTPGDDYPWNLVPSCWWCNSNRSWAESYPNLWKQWREWMGEVPPAMRPNLPHIVSQLLGISVEELMERP